MDAQVAVVGAGPYGLSVAAHLRHRGIETAVFGRPLDTWAHHMPAGMLLKSDGFASSLDAPVPGWRLADYCREHGIPYGGREHRVVLDDFVAYGTAFQQALVPDLDPRLVTGLAGGDDGFTLTLDDGSRRTARRVVVAVGVTHFAVVPRQLDGLGEHASHSGDHRHVDRFAGQRVAVLGAGSSAVETAAALLRVGAQVHLITRRAELPFWGRPADREPTWRERLRTPSSGLGPGWRQKACEDLPDVFRLMPADTRLRVVQNFLGPASGWWLKDEVLGGADVVTRTELRRAALVGDQVELDLDGGEVGERRLVVDHVIAATGYRGDLDRLAFLDDGLRSSIARVGAMPALSATFESSVPGLTFTGPVAAGSFGPLMRFMVGAEFAAPRIAGHLGRAARRTHATATRAA